MPTKVDQEAEEGEELLRPSRVHNWSLRGTLCTSNRWFNVWRKQYYREYEPVSSNHGKVSEPVQKIVIEYSKGVTKLKAASIICGTNSMSLYMHLLCMSL